MGGSNDDWKTSKDFKSCLMCNNDDWGWYEVLRNDCGTKEIGQSIADLCDKHQVKAMKAMMERTKID